MRRYVAGLGAVVDKLLSVGLHAIGDDMSFIIDSPTEETPVNEISAGRTDYRLRAWDDAAIEHRWLTEGVIAISQDEVGDLTAWPGDDDLRRRLEEEFMNRGDPRGPQAYGTFVRYWRYFRLDIAVGDLVAVPLIGGRVGIAEVTGDYEYLADEPDPRMRHVRPVRWLRQTDRRDLDETIRKVVNAPGTICRINNGNLRAEVPSTAG